ncbi:GDSL-type esterase/lipase family protein [Gilvimarinus polysaccharolyticus]|uniref:GDSL-type esterase/lipase family protein n=1 Tax=Gilvimarinus polysaccharolyticus TaxID=863921 RepID=UPI0006738699|nr:GDSL-type esterase/lipase family protein [Gilvimarinus polysaccharolyticus]
MNIKTCNGQRLLRFLLLSLLLSLLLVLSACSKTPALAPLAADARVLAFGDSLTKGTGAAAGQSYPEFLAQVLGRQVVNAGVPGEVSAQGLQRLPSVLDTVQPDLLILCHGGNDILRTLDKTQLAENLQAMIDLAQARDIPVVLIAVPQRSLLLRAEPLYQTLAEHNNIPLQSDIVANILAQADWRSDRVHPNGLGYQQLANAVRDLLHDVGAI